MNNIRNSNVIFHNENNSNLRTSFYNINTNNTQTLTPIKQVATRATKFVNYSNIFYNNNYRIIIPSQKYKNILNKQNSQNLKNYSILSSYNTVNKYINYYPKNSMRFNQVNDYGMNNNNAYLINNKNTIIHRPTHYQPFITHN